MSITKLTIATTLLLLLASTPAFARLGESPAEIAARYGPGQEEPPRFANSTEMKYSKNGFQIFVHFIEGKSVMEQFKRTSGKMSDQEIAAFLKTFSSGRPW